MKWKSLKESKPPFEKLILVFRRCNKKYVVLKLARDKNDLDCPPFWITQGNTCQDLSEDDLWTEFEYITETVTYA